MLPLCGVIACPATLARSALGWSGGDWDSARLRLVAHAGGTLVSPLLGILGLILAVLVVLKTFALLIVTALIGLWMLLL